MESTKVKYYIEADGELRQLVARIAQCQLPMVCKALAYQSKSRKAHQIRVIALEHGAVKMETKPRRNPKGVKKGGCYADNV